MKIAKEVHDITTQEMERSIDKNNLLKLEFNEKLHFANSQHVSLCGIKSFESLTDHILTHVHFFVWIDHSRKGAQEVVRAP